MTDSEPSGKRLDPGLAKLVSRGWISLAQFGRLIGVSYPTILKMKDQKKVRAIQVGHVYRVYTDEVERFLREGNLEPNKEQTFRTTEENPDGR